MRKLWLAAAVVLLSAAGLLAQSRMTMSAGRAPAGAPHPAAAVHSRSGFTVRVGSPFGFRGHGFGRSRGYYGYGVPYYSDFYPPYYDDRDYESAAPPPLPARAPEPVAVPVNPQPPPSPALLELQGNQWVKVSSFTMGQQSGDVTNQAAPIVPQKEMPPAVLVYRDGHTEELTSYSIIGPSIYTKSDYWANGAWTRTIQIADLDLPATLKANQQRGVRFELPSNPNEVMIRQ
jgi:hypothetical protein